MSDRTKCTPPPPPVPSRHEPEPPGDPELIRHALLWRFEDPQDRAAFERVCRFVWLRLNELGEFGDRTAEHSTTVGELTACAFDLMACSTDLERISRDPEFAELDARDRRLCQEAKRWAAEVAAIVENVCARIERPAPVGGPPASDPNGTRTGSAGCGDA